MNSVERVKKLCKDRKIPLSRLEKELGYSNGYISQLRKGVFPTNRCSEIAQYLNVSAEYIMNGSDTKNTDLTDKDEKDISKDLDNIMRKLKSGTGGPASYDGTEIPIDDLDLFSGQIELMLRHLKSINKEKYNPYKNKK